MNKTARLIFPNQLFEESELLQLEGDVFLVEEHLFFKQYNFHKRKICFHRETMKNYESFLKSKNHTVHYIDSFCLESDIQILIQTLYEKKYTHIHAINPVDNWLKKRLLSASKKYNLELIFYDSPMFLNTDTSLSDFFKPGKKKFSQTEFYIQERKKWKILVDETNKPIGGNWTYDTENRKKVPKGKIIAPPNYPKQNEVSQEALEYTLTHYPKNFGTLDSDFSYPTSFEAAKKWLDQFLHARFDEFGDYEDAIVYKEILLNHSLLSPLLNSGLLTPKYVVKKTIAFAENCTIPINSFEGFIRQIIGWGEFIRGIYIAKGTEERTKNFWGFSRKIPASFYSGTTGILPIDMTIKKIEATGYCHHIERLMVIGNFMLLCEFDPDEVYKWFMEVFIDSYDWVMVTNVYGMSQFADGGLMSTKPYISGSNYLNKMSDYPKGDWQTTWDALFWRFMDVHRGFFLKNPRLGMLVKSFDKMNVEKQELLHKNASLFLETL